MIVREPLKRTSSCSGRLMFSIVRMSSCPLHEQPQNSPTLLVSRVTKVTGYSGILAQSQHPGINLLVIKMVCSGMPRFNALPRAGHFFAPHSQPSRIDRVCRMFRHRLAEASLRLKRSIADTSNPHPLQNLPEGGASLFAALGIDFRSGSPHAFRAASLLTRSRE